MPITARMACKAALLLLLVPAADAALAGEGGIKHVVLCWLQQLSAANRARVIETSRELAVIPGIQELAVGEALPGDRAIVDDSFDVGVAMTFSNREDMENYLNHPEHLRRLKETFRPLCGKILVYDIAY